MKSRSLLLPFLLLLPVGARAEREAAWNPLVIGLGQAGYVSRAARVSQ